MIGPVNFPGHREENGQGEFGDGMGGVGWHRGDGDAEFLGGGKVDVVGAGAEGGDELGATLRKDLEACPIDLVVHKDEGCPVARTKRGGSGVELSFEELQLVTCRGVFRPQGGFGVDPGAENQRLHSCELTINHSQGRGGRLD